MTMPVRSLPVLQNWDCHVCGDCCRRYRVHVTEEERKRVESQGWADDPDFKGVPLFRREGSRLWPGRAYLNHRDDQSCVFLGKDGLCRIHAKFGEAAKPLACRVYPFVLVPTERVWRVGVRFSCPSATRNLGRPVETHAADVRAYARGLEEREGVAERGGAVPPLQSGQSVPWNDLDRFTKALGGVMADGSRPVEHRLRKCLALAALCRQAKFDTVAGHRLDEFLGLVLGGLDGEVPANADVPPPTWIGRVLFRQAAAVFARVDAGVLRGVSRRGAGTRFRAAVRFALGTGPLPKLHALLPDTTFERLEEPAGPPPPEAEALLERYYRVKLDSMQFFGPTNFRLPFWDGLESLALTYPVVRWLERAFRQAMSPAEALREAVCVVDDNFGFNPLLGYRRQQFAVRVLASRGELARLVAWYAR